MSIKVEFNSPVWGADILDWFYTESAIEEKGRDFKGNSTNQQWKWVPKTNTVYDGIKARAELYVYNEPYRFMFFRSDGGWRRAISDASGPPTIALSKIVSNRKYGSVLLHLGRELYDAIGYAPGWHEHLEYDDELYGPTIKIVAEKMGRRALADVPALDGE